MSSDALNGPIGSVSARTSGGDVLFSWYIACLLCRGLVFDSQTGSFIYHFLASQWGWFSGIFMSSNDWANASYKIQVAIVVIQLLPRNPILRQDLLKCPLGFPFVIHWKFPIPILFSLNPDMCSLSPLHLHVMSNLSHATNAHWVFWQLLNFSFLAVVYDTGAHAGVDVAAQSVWTGAPWLPQNNFIPEVAENGRSTGLV